MKDASLYLSPVCQVVPMTSQLLHMPLPDSTYLPTQVSFTALLDPKQPRYWVEDSDINIINGLCSLVLYKAVTNLPIPQK
jgi:hypothetical protein